MTANLQVPLDLDNRAHREYALRQAVEGLREAHPDQSASVPLWGWQRPALWTVLAVVVVCVIWQPAVSALVAMAVCTLAYVITLFDRILMFKEGLATPPIVVTDEEARAIPDDALPTYTVLVPAYNEPEVVADLLGAMAALEYPADKLQVLLLLEADDDVTIEAAKACADSAVITTVLVPPADPRTKPKACNYGMFFATGDIITIYDAEDLPDPLQLRRVSEVFRRLDDDIACVQAKLAFHNGGQNLLTGWFTVDYAMWFGYLLPGMMSSTSPIPLGGTSNHLRRDVLDEIGSWDPFNVTEDADLGLRIAATGYHTAVVDSTTLEEANSDPINWVRQRSRWYKGYLQTWLVHIRHPVKLFRTLGLRSFVRFNLVLAGTPIIAVLNLVFWLITVLWFLGQPAQVSAVFPPWIYFPALICLIIGNTATIYMNLITIRDDDRSDLLVAALTVPLYWVMMSIAATKGTYQIIRNPSYWEKTFHGLDKSAETAKAAPAT